MKPYFEPAKAIELAASMEDYAKFVANRRGIPPDVAIDAIELAEDIQKGRDTAQNIVARLRATAMKYRPAGHMMLTAQMNLIADRLEYERKQ